MTPLGTGLSVPSASIVGGGLPMISKQRLVVYRDAINLADEVHVCMCALRQGRTGVADCPKVKL